MLRRNKRLISFKITTSCWLLLLCLCASSTWAFSMSSIRSLQHKQASSRAASVASVLDAPLTTTIPEEDPSVGILLLNLGGPETSSDVEGFLFNLFKDPDIIRLPPLLAPLQPLIAFIISKRRAPQSRAAYDSIGGGSPILEYSHAQGRLLCEQLAKQYNMRAQYFIGMRYWYPFTEQALSDIVAPNSKIRALVVVPLYPHFSISTTGSSLRQVQKEWSLNPSKYQRLYHTVVPSWHLRPGYVAAMVDLIKHELDQFTPAQLEEATKSAPNLATRHVLFSAHGVPVSYIEAGDPYQLHIQQGVEAIAALLPEDVQIHTSYQSRVGPIEWLRPYTDDVLPELGKSGVLNLVVVPISFVSEHVETLEEIDIEYKELAIENGIRNWRRCPALNTNERFIQDMADMVVEALQEPVQTVTEACVANAVQVFEDDALMGDYETTLGLTGMPGGGGSNSHALSESNEQDKGWMQTERLNARVAMAGVLIVLLVELFNGKSLVQLFNGWS